MAFLLPGLVLIAAALDGILAGASLDQSIKQLPARHRIGAIAYSIYSEASDLGGGIVWYAVIGLGAAGFTLSAAIVAWISDASNAHAIPLYIAAGLALLHTLVTTQAAPILFSQRKHRGDEAALALVFNRFARWQTIRALLQVLTFAAVLWALAS